MDNKGVNKYDLNKYCRILALEFPFANKLNSTARQSSAERAWSSIARFYDNCKKKIGRKKGFPKFKKYSRSVEYKQSGWKLDQKTKKHITFTDKNNIGRVKLVGSRDIYFYQPEQIKRVKWVREKTAVILPIAQFEELLEDIEDLAIVAERRDEPTTSHADLIAELKQDGII